VADKEIEALKKYADSLAPAKGKRDSEKEKAWPRMELRASRDGVLVETNIALGEVVMDKARSLFVIADLSQLLVIANAPEDALPALSALEPDKRVWTVQTVETAPGAAIRGTFEEIGFLVDPNQHTATIKGSVPNPEGRLRAGQYITAIVVLPTRRQELVIPTSALVEDGRQTIVFVQPDRAKPEYVQRQVVVVRRGHDKAHVGFLLKTGERIVTTGALDLKAALDDLKAKGK
jgi:cobalt-zinc-cadmium efflux system membrane fusion protein